MKNATILIPTTNIDVANNIVDSFLNAKNLDPVYIQFVFLINSKNEFSINQSWNKFDSYELVIIGADRYFGSCEENIYRSQDFSTCFKDYVFCIGDGDEINWDSLSEALDYAYINNLDACAWNINHKQIDKEFGFSEERSIGPLEINSNANNFVKLLFNNEILPASIGFPALLSVFGPVDWAAYLGNHLFRKQAFQRILSYRTNEYVYSFVFKQLRYFTENTDARYGFIFKPVITRVAAEFDSLRENNGVKKISWLEDHRMVTGGSPVFWVAILNYLNSIHNNYIFDLVINSFMYSHSPDDNYKIYINYHSSLIQLLNWCKSSLLFKTNGHSYYLGKEVAFSSIYELSYIHDFLKNLKESFRRLNIKKEHSDMLLNQSIVSLNCYLNGYQDSYNLLTEAVNSINNLISIMTQDFVIQLHLKSFDLYIDKLNDNPT